MTFVSLFWFISTSLDSIYLHLLTISTWLGKYTRQIFAWSSDSFSWQRWLINSPSVLFFLFYYCCRCFYSIRSSQYSVRSTLSAYFQSSFVAQFCCKHVFSLWLGYLDLTFIIFHWLNDSFGFWENNLFCLKKFFTN